MYILQMIDVLSTGGAQQLLITFAKEASKRGFKLGIISLSEDDGSPYPDQFPGIRRCGVFFPYKAHF